MKQVLSKKTKNSNKFSWRILLAAALYGVGLFLLFPPLSLLGLILFWIWIKKRLWIKVLLCVLLIPFCALFIYALMTAPKKSLAFTGIPIIDYQQDPFDGSRAVAPYMTSNNKIYLYASGKNILVANLEDKAFLNSLEGGKVIHYPVNMYISLSQHIAVVLLNVMYPNSPMPAQGSYISLLDGSGKLTYFPILDGSYCVHNRNLYYFSRQYNYSLIKENLLTKATKIVYPAKFNDLGNVYGCNADGVLFTETNSDSSQSLYKIGFNGEDKTMVAKYVDTGSGFYIANDNSGPFSFLFYNTAHPNKDDSYNAIAYGYFNKPLESLACTTACSGSLSPDGASMLIRYTNSSIYSVFHLQTNTMTDLPLHNINYLSWLNKDTLLYTTKDNTHIVYTYAIGANEQSALFTNTSDIYPIYGNTHTLFFTQEKIDPFTHPKPVPVYQLAY